MIVPKINIIGIYSVLSPAFDGPLAFPLKRIIARLMKTPSP
jgi:hypothetical protein